MVYVGNWELIPSLAFTYTGGENPGNAHAYSGNGSTLNCTSLYEMLRKDRHHQILASLACVVLIYASGVLILAGLVGNILSFITLGRDHTNTTTFLLRALAVSDSIVLILGSFPNVYQGAILFYSLEETGQNMVYLYTASYVIGTIRMAQTASSWIIVALAFDRFLKVCYVSKSISITVTMMRRAVIMIAIACVIFHIPIYFERSFIRYVDKCTGAVYYWGSHSQFANTLSYQVVYSFVFQGLIRLFIPVTLLGYVNIKLIFQLRRVMILHRVIAAPTSHVTKGERSRTRMLIAVITIFIISQLPFVIRALTVCLEKFSKVPVSQFAINVLTIFSNFSLIANSAVNIIIYVLFSSRFRGLLLGLRRRKRRVDVLPSGSSRNWWWIKLWIQSVSQEFDLKI